MKYLERTINRLYSLCKKHRSQYLFYNALIIIQVIYSRRVGGLCMGQAEGGTPV